MNRQIKKVLSLIVASALLAAIMAVLPFLRLSLRKRRHSDTFRSTRTIMNRIRRRSTRSRRIFGI